MINLSAFKSRKLVLTAGAMAMVFIGYAMLAIWPSLETAFSTYVMGLLGAAGIYHGGNITSQWVDAKHAATDKEEPAAPEVDAPPPTKK